MTIIPRAPTLACRMLIAVAGIVVATIAQAVDLPDFSPLVDKYGPAVVNVQATGSPYRGSQRDVDPEEMPEIFRRFFGPQMPSPRGHGPRVSMGSGFILSSDGYVLTNNHVVDGADQVTVRLSDRRELDAKVIGTDAQYDIALLKLDASNLPVVSIGDSKVVKAGQWVVAIGSPFGFDHSVTAGIVSAVGRNFGGADQQYVPFIQTDVPINRGNSGGPLFNLNGQVIGINSQIFSNTGGFMGVSFAIPIDIAMNAVEQIKSTGRVSRGMIGVQIQNVDREQAKALGLPRIGGALVNQVTPGGGADKAGVQVGDVILAFAGRDIAISADLPPLVGSTRPGSKVELTLWRDGKTLTLPVTVGELPVDRDALASTRAGAAPAGAAGNALGIVVEDLSGEQRKALGITDDQGVVVQRIAGNLARRSALMPGDVILMVGRKPVKSAADFNASLKNAKAGDAIMLLVRRNEQTQFLAVTVPGEGADK
ncbi:MAG: DegQ family serine endoprotease [Xanthomonadales bacterium]|nr:DegQ family serine endoprotease [Xanthomonadales bacterium]MDL1869430.1 DegQ family serine endoprotease [Gammaproteobacteria bacterium PRO6]